MQKAVPIDEEALPVAALSPVYATSVSRIYCDDTMISGAEHPPHPLPCGTLMYEDTYYERPDLSRIVWNNLRKTLCIVVTLGVCTYVVVRAIMDTKKQGSDTIPMMYNNGSDVNYRK